MPEQVYETDKLPLEPVQVSTVKDNYHEPLGKSEYQQHLEADQIANAQRRELDARVIEAMRRDKVQRRADEIMRGLSLPPFELPPGRASAVVEDTRRMLHLQLYKAAEARADAEEEQREAACETHKVENGQKRSLDFGDFQHAAYRATRALAELDRAHEAYCVLAGKALTPDGLAALRTANEDMANYGEPFDGSGLLAAEAAEWRECWARLLDIRKRSLAKITKTLERHGRAIATLRYTLGCDLGVQVLELSRHSSGTAAYAFRQLVARVLSDANVNKIEVEDWIPWGR